MRRQAILGVFVLAALVMLAPDPALAQVLCFNDQNANSFRLEVGAFSGQLVTINGAYVSGGQTSTLSGTGRVQGDGKAQIGFTIQSSSANSFPLVGQVVLNPPGFNSGTGSTDSLGGGFSALTLTAASCPVLSP